MRSGIAIGLVFCLLVAGQGLSTAETARDPALEERPESLMGPPAIAFLDPSNNTIVNGSVQVRVSANDTDGMSRLEISLDGYVEYSNTSNVSIYIWVWDTTTTYNGVHALAADGLDRVGESNRTTISVTVNNTVSDPVPPSVAITSPANNSKVEGRVPVVANATDDTKLIQATFFVDGAAMQRNRTGNSPFVFLWDTSDPQNGSHQISVEAVDQANNRNTSRISVYLDNDRIRPTVSVLQPANGSNVKGMVDVRAQASDDRGVALVELYVDGTYEATNSSGSTGVYGFHWDSNQVAAGPHLLGLVAVDNSGNSNSSSVTIFVELQDKYGPAVSIVRPAPGGSYRRSVTVEANASDPSGVAKVEFLVEGSLASTVLQAPFVWDWDTRGAANGGVRLGARATDTLGNSNSTEITVIIQNPKAPAILSPKPGEKVYGNRLVNGTAGFEAVTVQLSIDDEAWGNATGTTRWEANWNTSLASPGDHTLYARSFDGVDFSGPTAVNVTVVRPLVNIDTPVDGSEVSGDVIIRGGSQYSIRVEVSIDGGATWETAAGVAEWNVTWPSRAVADGAYTIVARSWDGASYSANSSVAVTVTNPGVPPPGPVVPPEVGGAVALLVVIAILAALVVISRRRPEVERPVDDVEEEDEARPGSRTAAPPLPPLAPRSRGVVGALP